MILKPYMARENSLHDATYVYLTVERAVLGELSQRVQHWAMTNIGPAWHSTFVSDPLNYKVAGWKDPADPFYILKAFVKIPHTPLLKAITAGADVIELAQEVFHTRNLWAHYSHNQQMLSIKGDVRGLWLFAESAGLDTAKLTQDALTQLIKVTAGAGIAPPVPVVEPVPALAATVLDTAPQRPRIGSAWSDDLPSNEIDLNSKLRDVLDPQTGSSLRKKWPSPDLANTAIERWFDLKPTTPRLLYDERDGATVGFIEGFPYLFGYLGEEPPTPPEQYRGFLGQATYLWRAGDLVAQESGSLLALTPDDKVALANIVAERQIDDGEAFRVSNYNDLVHLSDDGPVRVFTFA